MTGPLHITCKPDRDRVRFRSTQKQVRKALMQQLADRGVYPAIDPTRLPKLADLEDMLRAASE